MSEGVAVYWTYWMVRLEWREVFSNGILFVSHWSRTFEWEDGEYANGDHAWPEFYQENAL